MSIFEVLRDWGTSDTDPHLAPAAQPARNAYPAPSDLVVLCCPEDDVRRRTVYCEFRQEDAVEPTSR